MLNRLLLCGMMLLAGSYSQAQDTTDAAMFLEKQFVIVRSSARYEDALKTAREAASKLQFKWICAV